jgi:nucleoside-diphosphate-sugar epimerase
VDVLVIGGNRFVGWLLGFRLLAAGHKVTLLNRGRLADPFGGQVDRIIADRTSRDLDRLMHGRRFDAVVDLAAFTREDGRRAAQLFAGCGHYVMVSTGQVYLVREGAPVPAREEDYEGPVMARPSDPGDVWDWEYGVGKRACEDALVEAHAASGFPATRVRIPMVNGERDYHRRMESYLWRLVDGGPVLLPGGGEHRVRHVYGGEVARFLAEILGRPETFGKAYNVAQEETPTLDELMAILRHHLGSCADVLPITTEGSRCGTRPAAGLAVQRPLDVVRRSGARARLGFRHEALEIYLGKIVASFLAHPPSDRPEGYARRDIERALAAPGGGPTA